MDAAVLGALWKVALQDHALLGRVSEEIIEAFYTVWLRPGDTAVDVGANVGRHLIPLARCVGETGKVFAYEPIPSLVAQVTEKLQAQALGWVELRQVAVADVPGSLTFHEVPGAKALSGLRLRTDMDSATVVSHYETKVVRLDDEPAMGLVKFIKVDVEGAEFSVFKGARALMSNARPVFAFEDGRLRSSQLYNYTMGEFYDYFEELEYYVVDIFGFVVGPAMNNYGGPWNFFAVPRESINQVRDSIIYANMTLIWSRLSQPRKD